MDHVDDLSPSSITNSFPVLQLRKLHSDSDIVV